MGEQRKFITDNNLESFEQLLTSGEKCLEKRKFNAALSLFKRANELSTNHPRVLLNLAKTYLALEKWSNAKRLAETYVKKHGNNAEMMQLLSKVYTFEGNYKKALSYLNKAARQTSDPKQIILEKENIEKLYREDARKKRILVLCAEGTDNFTDDIIKGLKEHFWVRKKVVPKRKFMLVVGAVLAYRKGFLSSRNFQLAVDMLFRTYLRDITSLLNWSDVAWIEWASELAVAVTNIHKGKSNLVVRLHEYEAFADYPYLIRWENVKEVVFVSQFMKRVLNWRDLEIDSFTRTNVIYNGVDLGFFEFNERKPGYNIGIAAYIDQTKNVALAIQILAGLVKIDKNYKLHIAGEFVDTRYELYIKDLIKKCGLEKNVQFYGWVDNMAEWWQDKQYLLSTSIHESFGYSIVEAMAMGIKPVIHDFYDAKELFEPQWLFRTVDEAVQMITSEEYDSAYYRAFVQQRYSLDRQVAEFVKLFQDLTKK